MKSPSVFVGKSWIILAGKGLKDEKVGADGESYESHEEHSDS